MTSLLSHLSFPHPQESLSLRKRQLLSVLLFPTWLLWAEGLEKVSAPSLSLSTPDTELNQPSEVVPEATLLTSRELDKERFVRKEASVSGLTLICEQDS